MTSSQRKQVTEKRLLAEGIPVNELLPCTSAETSIRFREPREIGIRLLCLFCVVGTAFDVSNDAWTRYLKARGFWEYLSPNELEFMATLDASLTTHLAWRCEAMVVLMWSLGLFPDSPLSLPRGETNTEAIIERLPALNDSPEPFLQSLSLRSSSEILDALDMVYRCHWAARDALLKNQEPPGGLVMGVVQQWHLALNWLICYQNQEWDDVSTDT